MANRFPLIFNSGAGQIQELAASDNLDLTSSNLVNAGILFTSSGSATAPSISIGSGTTYPPGLYSPGTDQLAISTNGTQRCAIDSNGRLTLSNSEGIQLSPKVSSLYAVNGSLSYYATNNGVYLNGAGPGGYLQIQGAGTEPGRTAIILNGSTANTPDAILFRTSNAECMRLDPSGRLGLGTSSPGSSLDVVSPNNSSALRTLVGSTVYYSVSNNSQGAIVDFSDNIGTLRNRIDARVGYPSFITAGNLGIGSTTPGSTGIDTGATQLFVVAPNSNFGCAATFVADSSGRGIVISDQAKANTLGLGINSSRGSIGTNASSIPLAFDIGASERARIDSSGRLGIGTSSVTGTNTRLEVANDSAEIKVSSTFAYNVNFRGIRFGITGDSVNYSGIRFELNGGELRTEAGFATWGGFQTFYTNGLERFRIDSSGRLGIGSTTPGSTGIDTGATQLFVVAPNSNFGCAATFVADSSGRGIVISDQAKANTLGLGINSSRGSIGTNASSIPLAFDIGASERARIDSSGRLLVGTSTARDFFGGTDTPALQVEGIGNAGRELSVTSSTASGSGGVVLLAKQRSGAVGGQTIVQSGDQLGYLGFQGSDGTKMLAGAAIEATVDGTPGVNDLPTRLVFSTTPDGGSSPTSSPPAMTIKSSQEVLIGTSTITANGGILQLKSGITFPATAVAASNANTLDDYEEGTWTPTQGAGLTVVGTFTSAGHYTKVGRQVTVQGFVRGSTSVVSAGGYIFCSGLPFAVQNANDTNFIGSGSDGNLTGLINIWIDRNQGGVYSVTSSAVSPSIYFTGSYFTP